MMMFVVEIVAVAAGGVVSAALLDVPVLPDSEPPTDCVVAAGCRMGV